jgi:hypothetical protein
MLSNEIEFELDAEDSTGIFYYAGVRKGQILGLMAPHLIAKYLKLIPVYTQSGSHPDHLKNSNEVKYGFVYSSTKTFDLAKSYELGFGRAKTGQTMFTVDMFVFLNHVSKNKFLATVLDSGTVKSIMENKKVNLAAYRKKP